METTDGVPADQNDVLICEADDTTCAVCYAEFLDPEDLKVHVEQVHPSGTFVKCHFCDKGLSDAENFVLHIRDAHLLDMRGCPVCTRVFADASQFRKHESIHPRSMCQGSFTCSQCEQLFLHKSELQQHEMEKHSDSKEGAFLQKYYPLLSSVLNIKAEIFFSGIGKDFVYTCNRCKYFNSDLEAYILHIKKQNCRSLVCDLCCKVFKTKTGLGIHLTHHKAKVIGKPSNDRNKTKSKVKCQTCNKCFDENSMKSHNCNQNIKCSHCQSVFETMYELSDHQTQFHPLAVALVVCKFCRKECVGGDSLEKHVQRAHNHELHLYKYTCSYCTAIFKHPQRLFAHYFLKHKDISPYLCKICDKPFRIRKGFTLHIKLQHKSEGFVEFDEKLHVFFTDKKSDKPFQPVSKYAREKPKETDMNATENTNKEGNGSDKGQDLQINMDSDVNPTDAEGNQTDAEKKKNRKSKRKKHDIEEILALSDYDSDDEPLLVTKKKAKLKRLLKRRPLQYYKKNSKKKSKSQLTCKICKKYCYTYQNYQNHVNMHFNDESKKCIKCSLSFKSKTDLDNHIAEQHSSSQLTETLKSILERRKKGEQKQEVSARMKFLNTIKKVETQKDAVTATLSPITKELSVQKFIESFTPEGGEVKTIQETNTITLTKVVNAVPREPAIKMTKFIRPPEINEALIKLSMPVKFRRCNERHSVTVKKVQVDDVKSRIKFTYEDGNQFQDDDNDSYYYQDEDNKESLIPEVEQEVTLGTEELPKRNLATHKIIIPKLPKELKSIRIAHLLPEAPYYKIVKVTDIIKTQEKKTQEEPAKEEVAEADVRLPDGTKLVHVNPLAHLLGNTPVEKIMKSSKYYKPKSKNFEAVLAKALRNLENGRPRAQNRKKKSDKTPNKDLIVPEKGASETVEELQDTDNEKSVTKE